MTYILILTMYLNTLQGSTAAMAHIEFDDKEACVAAANEWVKDIGKKADLHSELCVPKATRVQ